MMKKTPHRQNIALESAALFYDPTYLKMSLYVDSNGNAGPRQSYDYPGAEVLPNGDVVFTFYAPQAHRVAVCGLPDTTMTDTLHEMHPIEDGYWSVRVCGLPAGIHFHDYYVDGNRVLNPQTPIGYGSHRAINVVEIPDSDRDFYWQKEVPHGNITMELFPSSVTGKTRNCWVYTPPGYRHDTDKTYPVLYLQHGGGECETDWIWLGKINYIIDNLLAQGKCKEMLVVMNALYCIDERRDDAFLQGDFDAMLLQDCIPYIEANYRASPLNSMRAIAGLSMGSYQTTMTALTHLGMFPYVGVFSGTWQMRWYCNYNYRALFDEPQRLNRALKVLFFGYGQQEKRIIDGLSPDLALFDERGIHYHRYTCPGYHEWTVWRNCVYEFLQLIF
jgi:enterochelin esterase-like enzyme